MMYMNLLAGKAGIYIILKIRCSLYQEKLFKDGKVFLLNGRCILTVHTPSAPLGVSLSQMPDSSV